MPESSLRTRWRRRTAARAILAALVIPRTTQCPTDPTTQPIHRTPHREPLRNQKPLRRTGCTKPCPRDPPEGRAPPLIEITPARQTLQRRSGGENLPVSSLLRHTKHCSHYRTYTTFVARGQRAARMLAEALLPETRQKGDNPIRKMEGEGFSRSRIRHKACKEPLLLQVLRDAVSLRILV